MSRFKCSYTFRLGVVTRRVLSAVTYRVWAQSHIAFRCCHTTGSGAASVNGNRSNMSRLDSHLTCSQVVRLDIAKMFKFPYFVTCG